MANLTASPIPREQAIHEFQERGYLILPGILEPDVVHNTRRAAEKLVDQVAARLISEGKITRDWREEPLETRLIRLCADCIDESPRRFREELHLAELYGLFFHPALLDVVELFLGGEIRLYPNYTMRPKQPDLGRDNIKWHQDGAYTAWGGFSDERADPKQVESLRMVNVWTPLQPVRVANGCMQFVPGSHKFGLVPHEQQELELVIVRAYVEPHEPAAIPIELDPGDVVIFNNNLFHRGLPNHSGKLRWSLDWRYQDLAMPTMRREQGHVARSRTAPARAVRSPEHWASLTFS